MSASRKAAAQIGVRYRAIKPRIRAGKLKTLSLTSAFSGTRSFVFMQMVVYSVTISLPWTLGCADGLD
jgi:hypothetical protein